jgi:hypothetical protein
MQSNVDIKRGTTPTLPITIFMPFENVKHIDFIFKRELEENHPTLLEVGYDFPETSVEKAENSFIVNVKLSAEETRKLKAGRVYMDTKIILSNGDIPKTEIVEIEVGATLFKGENGK